MSAEVADRVRQVTSELLKVDIDKVVETAEFVGDLGAASIQSIELVAAYEEAFDIEMDQDEALNVKTVGDAIAYIAEVVAEQHG